jgi:hypothetical protein
VKQRRPPEKQGYDLLLARIRLALLRTAFHRTASRRQDPYHSEIPLDSLKDASTLQVRSHLVGQWGYWWAVDNVVVRSRSYDAVPGALATGLVTDANTHAALDRWMSSTAPPASHRRRPGRRLHRCRKQHQKTLS